MSGLQTLNITAPFSDSTCLVYAPHQIWYQDPGVTSQGNYITQAGPWTYLNYGTIQVNATHNLRQPAQGDFLRPQIFNGGCLASTCPSNSVCPGGQNVQASATTTDMFNYVFASQDKRDGFIVPASQLPGTIYNAIRSTSCG